MTVTIDLNGLLVLGNNNTTTFKDGNAPTVTKLFGSANVAISGGATVSSMTLSGLNPSAVLSLSATIINGHTFSITQSPAGSGTWVITSTGGGTPGAGSWTTALDDIQVNAAAHALPLGTETITITPTGTNLGTVTTGTETLTVTCFYAGTRIRTPDGEVAVETLKPGDLVMRHDGVAMPVRWLGKQTISLLFAPKDRAVPIRIKAGALGEAIPSRDLLVSPDHAMFVNGGLINAGALVNGTSVVRETASPSVFTYYHVEVDDHALIVAEGAPTETFVDNVDRMGFDNWREYQALYPEGKSVKELPYTRAKSHRQVPIETRVLLAARADAIGLSSAEVA